MRFVLRWAGRLLIRLIVASLTAWCAGGSMRVPAARAWAAILRLASWWPPRWPSFLPRRGRTLIGFLIAFIVVITWWIFIPASNRRDWQAEVAVTRG
jgi:hypothetical protein